jgi:hypothetical protein
MPGGEIFKLGLVFRKINTQNSRSVSVDTAICDLGLGPQLLLSMRWGQGAGQKKWVTPVVGGWVRGQKRTRVKQKPRFI